MKRILAVLLALVLTLSLATAALAAQVQPTKQNITIDGEDVYCPAYNIDGYNYVKLRTLAYLMRETDKCFDVLYDEGTKTVKIVCGQPYSGPAEEAFLMVDLSGTAVESAQTIVIDGVERSDLSVWNLGGNNWFKLAELSKALGFGLHYDAATDTAAITTTETAGEAAGEYAPVYAALTAAQGSSGRYATRNTAAKEAVEEAMDVAAEVPAAAEGGASGKGGDDYAGTNVQVEGVDEGDIVKTDGKYIYVIHDDELIIFQADGANTVELSRTTVGMNNYTDYDYSPKEDYSYFSEYKYPEQMFVGDGRLALILTYSQYDEARTDGKWVYHSKNYVCVDFYDVSDPASPKKLQSLGQDGSLLGSRMMNGKLFLLSNYWVWDYEEGDPTTYVPGLYKDGEMHILPVDKIYIGPACASTEYVVACAYDLAGGTLTASQSVLGCGDTIYMNESGVYVLGSNWKDTVTNTYTESVYTVEEHVSGAETRITRFAADDLHIAASGAVPGSLESQFSADEYQGYLRLVATRNDSSYKVYKDESYEFENYKWDERKTTNGLYILDGGLNIVSSIEDIAPGERVYSARFDGPIGYFCTFRNVDPLFAADLSDPTAPKILSALKISGFSEYLHGWSADRLFGLGNEADEEDGWREGLKLVMFDTSDKTDVTVKHTLVLDDVDYSAALYDHKAVFIDPVRGYIGFPAEDQYLIYAYDDASGFTLKYQFDSDSWLGSARGLRIGETAYIVSYDELIVIDMTGWTWTLTLPLDEAVG